MNIYKEITKVFDAIAMVHGKRENVQWLTSESGKKYAINENGERVLGDPRATGGAKKIINKERSQEKLYGNIQKAGPSYRDDQGNIVSNKKLYGKNKITKKSDIEAYNKMPSGVKKIYDIAMNSEEKNTKQLSSLAKKFGMNLVGENAALKMPKSTMRKIRDNISLSDSNISEEEEASKLYDINRYTMTSGPNDLVEKSNNVLKHLLKSGYSLDGVKNYWETPDESNYYNGFNCKLTSPSGNKLELQFHTLGSFQMKEFGTHKYYEIERDMTKSEEERQAANKIAYDLVVSSKRSGRLKVPKNYENFAKF